MIGDLVETGAVRRRILQTLFPLLLTLPRRNNFTQQSKWCEWCETTLHNWQKRGLGLAEFNCKLIERHGSGEHMVIFDPSYLPKSGKRTPGLGRYWSGQAGAVKRGIEVGSFAIGDLGHHTAFHLAAELTPSASELKKKEVSLMGHYVGLVSKHRAEIARFGDVLVCDAYFGVSTYVEGVVQMGITLISCLKANAALYYPAPLVGQGAKKRGRPRKKGDLPEHRQGQDREPCQPCPVSRLCRKGRTLPALAKGRKRGLLYGRTQDLLPQPRPRRAIFDSLGH